MHSFFSSVSVPTRMACLALLSSLFLACITLVIGPGCDTRPKAVRTNNRVEQEDPLVSVYDTLRKDRDQESCKGIIAQLNGYLSREDAPKPASLSETDREQLVKLLNLTPAELKEVTRTEFSTLDANYLDECLLLQDGLRWFIQETSPGDEAAQIDRAQSAFDWAMRQVWRSEAAGPSAPPSFVLRRGSGTDMERAALALAVFQVMGLDGCLIARKSETTPQQPWAVGARIGSNIFLFDPRSGQPIRGPMARGVATFAQAKSNPDLVKAQAGGAPPVDAKVMVSESGVFVCPPLSALSPRMRLLESLLKLSPAITLAVDLDAMTKRFQNAGATVAVWNPGKGQPNPVRSLAHFLPESEGGFNVPDPEKGLTAIDQYARPLVPWALLPPLLKQDLLAGEPGKRLTDAFRMRFLAFFLLPKKPRDLVLRGQFDQATRDLVEISTTVSRDRDLAAVETDLEQGAREWAGQMLTAAANLKRAEDGRPGAPSVAEARARVEQLYKESRKISLLIEQAAGEPYDAQATFLLALTKHEQAERLTHQARDPQDLQTAWQNAESWWNIFLTKYDSRPWIARGQLEHARMLLSTARQRATIADDKKP